MKDFKYKLKMDAEIEDVWRAFTSAASMELWTGYPAIFEAKPESEFELWEGDITGKVIEVEEYKKIVEQWYFDEQEKPSIATIKFFQEKNKIKVELYHENIPDDAFDNITEGWVEYYFKAIKEFVEVE